MDDDSDSSSVIDDYEFEELFPEDEDDADKIRKGSHPLGLSRSYIPKWNCADSLREIIQNWKDGIVESYGLDPRSFVTHLHETKNEIQITVHRPTPNAPSPETSRTRRQIRPEGELLGFIRFKRKQGSIELANFNAALTMQNLSLGGTTKHGDDKFVGTHGEGFKLAALVMLRNNRRFQIKSSSASWNFSFKGVYQDRFTCSIGPATDRKVENDKAALERETTNKPRASLKAYIHQDVVVKIYNRPSDICDRITEDQFNDWIAVSLDIKGPPPDAMIRTEYGDLLLDERFAGRIYLKSLRVKHNGAGGKRYHYGYNFAEGEISRDREQLTNSKEKALMLADIWGAAMQHEEHGGDLVPKYIALFGNSDYGDVFGVEDAISEHTARLIWRRLRTDAPGEFFYSEDPETTTEYAPQADIITNDIKKQPRKLPNRLWKVLRRFSLARTPEEQRLHLFESSSPIPPISSPFAAGVERMLRTVLSMDPRLRSVTPVFVNGGNIGINLHYKKEQKALLIHRKWLDFGKAHENSACEFSKLTTLEGGQEASAFACDHVVEDLFELAVNDLRGHLQISPMEAIDLRREARERLHQTPRDVQIANYSGGNALQVTWIGTSSGVASKYYEDRIFCIVALHAMSSCENRREELVKSTNVAASEASCRCEHRKVGLSESSATFHDLDPAETYFALLWHHDLRPSDQPTAGISSTPQEGPASSPLPYVDPANDDNGNDVDDSDIMDMDDQSLPMLKSESPVGGGEDVTRQLMDAWNKDEQEWNSYQETELTTTLTRGLIMRTRCSCDAMYPETSFDDTHYDDERLDFTFEKNQWIVMRDRTMAFHEYVAWVHEVHAESENCINKPHLTITKYSSCRSDTLLWEAETSGMTETSDIDVESEEMLLHFSSLHHMGQLADAEVIEIDDITVVRPASAEFCINYAKFSGKNSSNL
ncbi:hypothetical protein CkaCkLH20_06102 [Colletotrichum karsti]|uniref:Uncharacterized protein n=1 Tax=Colletotrichum karsti TaxID=1095194 RepID=A0A9P6I526_9PEZI|nr:uncharacterized protein CkaCkLH20_06102 [Colletotrichum karsti]KAF9876159.1 hypothetical protein CkaCkLH20_06102 [Colletotrichum karsti]